MGEGIEKGLEKDSSTDFLYQQLKRMQNSESNRACLNMPMISCISSASSYPFSNTTCASSSLNFWRVSK